MGRTDKTTNVEITVKTLQDKLGSGKPGCMHRTDVGTNIETYYLRPKNRRIEHSIVTLTEIKNFAPMTRQYDEEMKTKTKPRNRASSLGP